MKYYLFLCWAIMTAMGTLAVFAFALRDWTLAGTCIIAIMGWVCATISEYQLASQKPK